MHFGDIDGARHVNNVVYFQWFEAARTAAYVAIGGATRVEDYDIIIASTQADFLRPVMFGDTVDVLVTPGRVGTSSFEFLFEVRNVATGVTHAKGRSVQVAYDHRTSSKKPIPPRVRAALPAT